MISQIRAWIYKKGFLGSIKLPGYVISIGNISMGGTGKSPFVMELAQWAVSNKIRTAILSRGYKRKSNKLYILPPDAKLPSPREMGDEPWMIKNRVPGVSILVHKHRARMALRHWNKLSSPQLIILDDGFQHWQVKRDCDIVMVDASESLEGKSIPFGRLRETSEALRRASLIILTRANEVEERVLEAIKNKIIKIMQNPITEPWQKKQKNREPNVLLCGYEFDSYLDFRTGSKTEVRSDHEFLLLSGIAKPGGLRDLAKEQKLNIKEELYFSDHHLLSSGDKNKIKEAFRSLKEGAILVTEKDWARWKDFLLEFPGYVIRIKFSWLENSASLLEKFFEEVRSCSTSP